MKFDIHYANTQPTPWIESTLRTGFEDMSDRMGGLFLQQLRILFEVVNGKTKPGKDLYRCKVFGYSEQAGRFVIQKSAGSPEELLNTVLQTARKVLGKRKFARSHPTRRLVFAQTYR